MKRFAAIFLVLVLALSLAVPASAVITDTLTMTPSAASYKAGDTVSIVISTSYVASAKGLEFHVILPPTVFENVSVGTTARTSALAVALLGNPDVEEASFSGTVTAATGKVNYIAYWNNACAITPQNLLTITATVKADAPLGSVALAWDGSCVYSDASNAAVSFSKTDSAVSIYAFTAASIPIAITAPVKYATAETTVADGTGYTCGTFAWGGTLNAGKFLAGTAYTATVQLNATADYKFNANQTVTVAGATVAYNVRTSATMTFTATFPATAAMALTSVTIPTVPVDMAVPESGNTATQPFQATGSDSGVSVDISGSTTWSLVDPVSHNAASYPGIAINGTSGLLTVFPSAAQNTFTTNSLTIAVKATAGGFSDFKNVIITRVDSVATRVDVSGGPAGDGTGSIIVPEDSAVTANTSAPYTARVYDQYGVEMTGVPLTWTIKYNGSVINGVSIDNNGIVTVTKDAKGDVTNTTGLSFDITATTASASGLGLITVKRAAPVATTVTVANGQGSILVPADGAGNNTSAAFTASVLDQYGTAMTGQTIVWTVKNGADAVNGVTINSGVVTVANSAKSTVTNTAGISFTVKAAVGSANGTASITVQRATSVFNRIDITRGGPSLATDLLIIPPAGVADYTYTYTATVYDQYSAVMPDAAGAWSGTIGAVAGVTRTNNVVTVNEAAVAAADAGTIVYTEGLSGSSNTKTINISLSTLSVNWSGITISGAKTYGATYASFVTAPATGTASDGAATVNGTFSVVNGTSLPNVSDTTVTVRFTGTQAPYVGVTIDKTYTITVNKKTLTVTPDSGKTKVYGAVDPEFTKTYTGNLTGQTPAFTGALSRTAGENVGTYNITVGTLALADNAAFIANNYTLALSATVKTFSITKATIAITTAAPHQTVLANDTANTSTAALKAIADSGSALPATVAISYSGQTGTLAIVWAEAAQTFNAKSGTYTYIGTVAADANYANRPILTATVTVTPVAVTAVKQDADTALKTIIVIAKADVLSAASLSDLGVPTTAYLTFDNAVGAMSGQAITWNKTIADVKTTAGTVTNTSGDKTITLTMMPATYPAWATAPTPAKTLTITITNKYPVTVTFTTPIDDITYGTALATPAAAQTAINNGTDAGGTYTFKYVGTGTTTYAASTTPPTHAGTYKVTATLESTTHAGYAEDTFTIGKKALANSMITGITPAANTYDGTARKPVPTVTDAAGPIAASDYTVSYVDNTDAGTAAKVVITATAGGNYSGTAEYTFTIDPAALTGIPTIIGTPAVGNVLTAKHTYAENQVTYQWTRGGADIGGATAKAYTLTTADSNKVIAVKVTGTDNHTGTITSANTDVAKQAVTGTVIITGGSDPIADTDTLTAVITGILPAEAQTGATYQWKSVLGDVTTTLGTTQTQALTGIAADSVVTVTVTPNTDFTGTLTASVVLGKTPLISTLTIAGADLAIGDIITPAGQVNGADLTAAGTNYTLQWMRNGVNITGATGVTYTVIAADLGTVITLKAVGTGTYTGTVVAAGARSVPAVAPAAPVIRAAAGDKQITVTWTAPAANGSPITGYTLYVKAGNGAYDSGTLIGADAVSYVLTGLTNGTIYKIKLTATNAAGTSVYSVEATSNPMSSGGGGGGGSSGGSGVDVQGPGGSAGVDVTVNGSNADITVDQNAINGIFGTGATHGTVTLDVSGLDDTVTEITLPPNFIDALQNAVDSGNTSSMNIDLPGGNSITLDKKVLETICDAAGNGQITIGITPVTMSSLPASMRDTLHGRNVSAVFEISVTSGGTEISNLGGTATVTFAVTFGQNDKSAKVYKIHPDGTAELVKSNFNPATGEVTMERDTLSTYAVVFSDKPAWVNPYNDAAFGQWYYEDVEYVSQNNLMTGVTASAFDPSSPTTRAMVATILWRLEGKPAATKANPFTDVAAGQWYTEAIAWAAEKGIITGIGGSQFNPNGLVTREQIATMLYRYAQYKGYDVSVSGDTAAYGDNGQISSYAVTAMKWAYGEGLITGRTASTLAPLGSAQRSEVAALFHRFIETISK